MAKQSAHYCEQTYCKHELIRLYKYTTQELTYKRILRIHSTYLLELELQLMKYLL